MKRTLSDLMMCMGGNEGKTELLLIRVFLQRAKERRELYPE